MMIVKVGGGENINLDYILEDFCQLPDPKILVHGGNYELDQLFARLNEKTIMVTSRTGKKSRYTDQKVMNKFLMIYAGKINKRIVVKLQALGCNAWGLTGLDGGLVKAKKHQYLRGIVKGKKRVFRDDLTGSIKKINISLLTLLLENNYTPVITPPALSLSGQPLNIDGDKLAYHLAKALSVKKLIYLFEAPGILENYPDGNSLISHFSLAEKDQALQFAQGRMKKKVIAAFKALENGISQIYLGDGRVAQPLKNLLNGKGTIISQEEK